jgi:hypothetical protein
MILVFDAGRPAVRRGLLDLDAYNERGAQKQTGRLRKALQEVTNRWFGESRWQAGTVQRQDIDKKER